MLYNADGERLVATMLAGGQPVPFMMFLAARQREANYSVHPDAGRRPGACS
jgi:hypothetical protein